jgi:hypothetical protein
MDGWTTLQAEPASAGGLNATDRPAPAGSTPGPTYGFARERVGKMIACLIGRPAAAPQGYFSDGIIDATAMNYEPLPYAGDTALFQPIERPTIFDYRPGWADTVRGELLAFDVPGGHHTMLQQPNVRVLGEKLRAWLERAQAKHQMAKHGR